MLKSINYWSFPGGLEMRLDPKEAIKMAAANGFQAIEMCIGEPGSALATDAAESTCRDLRSLAESEGLSIPSTASGLYWGRALGDSDPKARAQAKEDLVAMLRIASWLGAKTHLTIPGAVEVFFLPDRPVQPYAEVLKYATEGLAEILPQASECGVRLGIENVWNKFLLSPTEMLLFVNSFGSPWIGSYLDVANVLLYGYPEQWIRTLGNKLVGVHFKDYRRAVGTVDGFVDLLEGDVDWPSVMAALSEVGYNGPVVAEMIPGYRHHPMVRIRNTSCAMDAILNRTS